MPRFGEKAQCEKRDSQKGSLKALKREKAKSLPGQMGTMVLKTSPQQALHEDGIHGPVG